MDYSVVDDPAATARHALGQKALHLDEIAFQAEFNAKEMACISQLTQVADLRNINAVNLEAQRKRREANAYIKESEISEKQLLEGRVAYLKRLIFAQEHSHVTHSAELKVKATLGEPTASHDSILEALDRGHELANQMLGEITAKLNTL